MAETTKHQDYDVGFIAEVFSKQLRDLKTSRNKEVKE